MIGEVASPEKKLHIRYARMVFDRVETPTGLLGGVAFHTVSRLLHPNEDTTRYGGGIEPVLAVGQADKDEYPIRLSTVPVQLMLNNESPVARLPCAVVPTRYVTLGELGEIWDKVGLTENKDIVADALRIIEPGFQDLMFINKSFVAGASMPQRHYGRTAIVKLAGPQRPVPINSMGDGMARILQLILKVFSAKGGFLLIDEFENGLHYSVQEKVWEMMFMLADKLDIQVFATTHSWDCIESFAKVAQKREAGDGVLFRVGRSIRTSDNGKITATVFDGQQLFDLTQAEMEVR